LTLKRALLLLSVCSLLGLTVPAAAHGDVDSTSPEDGSTVKDVPGRVTITLTETPSDLGERSLVVRDGCGRRVVTDLSLDENTMIARIGDAQPGRWRATWQAISAVDGHATEGEFSFTVRGSKDCNPDEPTPEATDDSSPEPDDEATADVGIDAEPASDSGDGSSFPILPVVVGVAIIGLAIAARSFAGR
jgi:copper resistance protein C